MLSDINNQYLKILDNVVLSKSKGVINLIIDKRNQRSDALILEIDETAMNMLLEINGQETVNQFIIRFCSEYNLSYITDYNWILTNLGEMTNNLIIDVDAQPAHCKLKVVGDENFINPLFATVEVTTKCNLNCQHCYSNGSITNQEVISSDQFKQLVATLQTNNVINIELTGGEFFTHPEAVKILECSLKNFNFVGLWSNGIYIPDEAWDLIAKYKDKMIINISIDSVNEQVHDQFRGLRGSFKRTLSNMQKLVALGAHVRVSSVLFKENMWEFEQLVELAKKYNAIQFTYSFIEKVGRGVNFSDIEFESLEQKAEYLDYINAVTLKNKDYIPVVERHKFVDSSCCGAGHRSITIDSNGDIRPCVLFPSNKLFGNVLTDEYQSIFEQEIYQQMVGLQTPDIKNGCDPQCPNLNGCKGCIFHAFDYLAQNEISCQWIETNGYQRLNKMLKPIFKDEKEKR